MTIEEISEKLQTSDDPVAKALHIGDHFKVLIFGFKKGMHLQDHEIYHPTRLLVMSGKIIYRQDNNEKVLNTFEEMEVPVNIIHSVEALDDSFVLLTQG